MNALLCLLLSATPTTPTTAPSLVAVVDVSASDAVYEDVSRGLAEDVVAALAKAGLAASRVDENELPPEGCRAGPCLEKVARTRQARALVIVDAKEEGPLVEVSVMALDAADGRPLGAKRYTAGKKAAGALRRFSLELARALSPRDAGG